MITVLVHYEEWVDSPHPKINGFFAERSKVVEVNKFTDLNDIFDNIKKVKVLDKGNN